MGDLCCSPGSGDGDVAGAECRVGEDVEQKWGAGGSLAACFLGRNVAVARLGHQDGILVSLHPVLGHLLDCVELGLVVHDDHRFHRLTQRVDRAEPYERRFTICRRHSLAGSSLSELHQLVVGDSDLSSPTWTHVEVVLRRWVENEA